MKTTARIIAAVVLSVVLLTLLIIPVSAAKPSTVVTFSDPEMDLAMHANLGIPASEDIHLSDLRDLTRFYDGMAYAPGDLTGIEYCINLESFTLGDQGCPSLAPLAKLPKLKEIRLLSTHITDLSQLSKLTGLQTILIEGHGITDLTPLAKLTKLQSLSLYNEMGDLNAFSDISPLTHLTKLETLNLQGNHISDLSPLIRLDNLNTLNLSINPIRDIGALVNNRGLGNGDSVALDHTLLDLTPGSQTLSDIQALIDRGVSVSYSNDY